MSSIKSYKELIVWQKSMVFVESVYSMTATFPAEEIYGLTSQIRRAAVSIPSNIAEGSYRSTKKDYVHFLRTALGSAAEIETQIEIALRIKYISKNIYEELSSILAEVMKMLNGMVRKLS